MMTEKEAWESILDELTQYAGKWLCHDIESLQHHGDISWDTHDSMFAALDAERRRLRLGKAKMNSRGLWGYASPLRIAWVKKQIKRLEKESAPSVLP